MLRQRDTNQLQAKFLERWLGITVVEDDRLVRLPAEMGGMLPPISALGRTPTSPATT